ncbi:MAG: HemK/PrmC family methyltransferase [Actinomycetes bacterium]
MTLFRQLVQDAARQLELAGVSSPEVDATELLKFAISSQVGVAGAFDDVSDEDTERFQSLIDQRVKRIPLQHLTGVAYFRHLTLQVGPGVFVPRPETELLAQVGIDYLSSGMVAVDLCAGSGAVALALATEVSGVTVHAVERSIDAVEYLKRNVAANAELLSSRSSQVFVHLGDATDQSILPELFGVCDVVLSNPPYIPAGMIPREPEVRDFDPEMALYGGDDGFDIARGVIAVAAQLLRSAGVFAMEHADVQGPTVNQLFDNAWVQVQDHNDYNDLPRYVVARRNSARIGSS